MAGSRPASGNSLAVRQPSVWIPLRYFMAAQVAFLTALFWAPFRVGDLLEFYYQGHDLALTHLITLGWITLTIMGASFQLVPVALETSLYSERLARWQFWIVLLGVTTMVSHFWIGEQTGMVAGAGMVLLAILLFLINMGRTLWQLPRWDIVACHAAAALFYLAATVILGNLMALDKLFDILGGQLLQTIYAHAHLAALGWISMMILGVGYKLIPMFSLAELKDERLARREFWLLNAGIIGLFWTLLLGSQWAVPFALLIGAAFGLFLWQVRLILRDRRRPRLDWGLRLALSALAYLPLLVLLGVWLLIGRGMDGELATRLAFGYGVLALLGWISVMIVGMLFKIVPFLIWHHRYSDLVGTRPVPAAAHLLGAMLPRAEFWALHAGILTTVAGLILKSPALLQTGTIVLALAGLLFLLALGKIYSHLVPSLTPLPRAGAPNVSGRQPGSANPALRALADNRR